MSSSCGYNFFYQNDELFQKYLGDFYKNTDLQEYLTDFTIIIRHRKPAGHFFHVWVIWNMSALQDSSTMSSWNCLRAKNIIL